MPDDWEVDTINWYLESSFNSGVANTSGQRVYDLTGTAVLTNSGIDQVIAVTRRRSSAITMPVVSSELRIECNSDAGTVYFGPSALMSIIEWTNEPEAGGAFLFLLI